MDWRKEQVRYRYQLWRFARLGHLPCGFWSAPLSGAYVLVRGKNQRWNREFLQITFLEGKGCYILCCRSGQSYRRTTTVGLQLQQAPLLRACYILVYLCYYDTCPYVIGPDRVTGGPLQ
ncbi:uncharacterized protein LOC132606046 isoform X2 [Lycium barbarum]|uniref:uncharacterized protein LOC132606046 isoform X2 n=1 Tax=Lycium barbarum TaxID=112863 RepID=UPI00293F5E25|nr:uncharacterized protein LOC132606046 isoform X2 [Lycium barbarum]